ncbi:MAG: ribosome biogenesis GTPase Der [Rickettsiales bacterium]
MSFTVVIAGRPNVGKSTLFNRLTGKRHALVDDVAGVTRDLREGMAEISGVKFTVFDTAGLEEAKDGSLAARMSRQSEKAIEAANIVLFVVDARAGITPVDKYFAALIRKKHSNPILLINKAEGGKTEDVIAEAYSLGFGEPILISAEHGIGMGDLYDVIAPLIESAQEGDSDDYDKEEDVNTTMRISIIGRPNVGKSTLVNKLLGEERVLTGDEAGITRDSIEVDFEFEDNPIKLVDTAGMRKKSNVIDRLEKMAVADSLRTIRYSHVVILVIDANAPMEKQENNIASLIEREGRSLVIAINKWDSVKDKPAYMKEISDIIDKTLPQLKGVPLIPISAKTGFQIHKLLKTCFEVYELWNKKISTGELNRWLEAALEYHSPPLVNSRRIKIRYITQKSSRPPSFLLFSNNSDIPESYIRYLRNGLRESFNLPSVPIRIKIRKNKNPYSKK